MRGTRPVLDLSIALLAAALACACHDDDGVADDTGTACSTADECFLDVADGGLVGEAICLDRVEDGYCTHTCTADTDCCAADGECAADHYPEVCAPFENTDETKYCFLSCEGQEDGDAFCDQYAHRDFICRSTGGGSENRKVCVP
jgi:hypothetical protein